jgi:hypothetical protein
MLQFLPLRSYLFGNPNILKRTETLMTQFSAVFIISSVLMLDRVLYNAEFILYDFSAH